MSSADIVLSLSAWVAACVLICAFLAGAKRGRGDDDEVQG